jgi:hypothetical protein
MLVSRLAPAVMVLLPSLAHAQTTSALPVTVTVAADRPGAELPPHFLGLSYETSLLLPKAGRYYFDANDRALVNMFQTLGIKSLRVGANAVDDPRIAVPGEKDIDALFAFARAAGVKVIYSFRLKNGDPSESARLAAYIAARYPDQLDCFAVGNEPNFYIKPYQAFFRLWKPHYDAILKAVPGARLEGPSSVDDRYPIKLAKDVFAQGHLAMATNHYYFLGSGREAEKNPAASRARFLSNMDGTYANAFAKTGEVLAGMGVPYRIDEMNSCYNGGAKDSSDTFASTLWALSCIHWWAAHHIAGLNFHTGELVGRDGKFGPPNYAVFLRAADEKGFAIRPQGYSFLAFSQGARGRPLAVTVAAEGAPFFNAYAYQDRDGSFYVTLINRSYGEHAQSAAVSVRLPGGTAGGTWKRLDLVQKDQDVAAKAGVTLGGSAMDTQGNWKGQWGKIEGATSPSLTVQVPAASATILVYARVK